MSAERRSRRVGAWRGKTVVGVASATARAGGYGDYYWERKRQAGKGRRRVGDCRLPWPV